MKKKRVIAGLFLVLATLPPPADAYVDPVSSRSVFHILSAVFILGSAAFVFLKNQVVNLFRMLARLIRRMFP